MRSELGAGGRCTARDEAPVDAREHRRLPGKRSNMGRGVVLVLCIVIWSF